MALSTPDMYERLHLLQEYRHVAIVGVSADPYRPSHFVAIYLQAEGYDIIPINPRYAGQTLLGKRVYTTLTEASNWETDRDRRRLSSSRRCSSNCGRGYSYWGQSALASTGYPQRRGSPTSGRGRTDGRPGPLHKNRTRRFFGGLHTVGLNTGVVLAKKL